MRPSQEAALASLTDLLGDVHFVVGGSALAALLGAEVEPADIDIAVAADDRRAVREAVGERWRGEPRRSAHPHVGSAWLAELEVEGEQVEVMGGLELQAGGVRWLMPLRSGGSTAVRGREVPRAAVGPWVVLYALYRPEGAIPLLPFVEPAEARRTAREVPFATLGDDPATWPSVLAPLGLLSDP